MSDADRRDPAATAEAALLLLSRGRADMARRLLEPLPGLIREALRGAASAAYEAGRDDGVRAARKAKPPRPSPPAGGRPKPAFRRQARELLELSDHLGVRRVAEVLGLRPADLPPLFAGTVEVSRTALAKLRREAADEIQF